MIDTYDLKENTNNIVNFFSTIKYNIRFRKEHPHYFNSDGLVCFVGAQGSGKTLSAVNYVYHLMARYPKCLLVTNVMLKDYPIDNERVFLFKGNDDFSNYSNGEYGVIYFVDEIQLYLNSLGSKNVNMEVITQISQQRKQRKHIVATSQVFGRLAKPLREQFSNVVLCRNYFSKLQINKVINRQDLDKENSNDTTISGNVSFKYMFIHSPKYYERYDTYSIIQYEFENGKEQEIYE